MSNSFPALTQIMTGSQGNNHPILSCHSFTNIFFNSAVPLNDGNSRF